MARTTLTYITTQQLPSLLLVLFLFIVSSHNDLQAQYIGTHDTIFQCTSQPLTLTTRTGFDLYSWEPAIGLVGPSTSRVIITNPVNETYIVKRFRKGTNLIVNGDFAQGNTGFRTEYKHVPNGTFEQKTYAILDDPRKFNQGFGGCNDHSADNDLMMVIDGSTELNDNIWCQTVTVEPQRDYTFSCWATNVPNVAPAILQFSINGRTIGMPFEIPNEVCRWIEFFEVWNSGTATTAEICITNQVTIDIGNDLALDDIEFAAVGEEEVDTFTVILIDAIDVNLDTLLCADQSFDYRGQTLRPGNTYTILEEVPNGCDTNFIYTVGLRDTIFETLRVDSLCEGDVFMVDGVAFTQDTIVCVFLPAAAEGCDSLVCYDLRFFTELAVQVAIESPSCYQDRDAQMAISTTAGLPPYEYQWSGPEGSGVSLEDTIRGLVSGDYSLTVIDNQGCIAVKPVRIDTTPVLSFTPEAIGVTCARGRDGRIAFNIEGGTPPYRVRRDNGDFEALDTLSGLESRVYPVSVRDSEGCGVQGEVFVPDGVAVVVSTNEFEQVALGKEINVSVNHNARWPYIIEWSAEDSLTCTNCITTTITPLNTQYLSVQITDREGCVGADSTLLTLIKTYPLYIPNAFSPNGDGFNEFFRPLGGDDFDFVELFQVFDRWGDLLHEERNCKPCGWNGNLEADDSAGISVYTYYMRVRFIDGVVQHFSGDVTLVR